MSDSTEPSELRGDVISRKAAIEAFREDIDRDSKWWSHAFEDAIESRIINIIRNLSALPSVPEPPNDAKTLNEMMAEIVEFEHGKGWQPNDTRFLGESRRAACWARGLC